MIRAARSFLIIVATLLFGFCSYGQQWVVVKDTSWTEYGFNGDTTFVNRIEEEWEEKANDYLEVNTAWDSLITEIPAKSEVQFVAYQIPPKTVYHTKTNYIKGKTIYKDRYNYKEIKPIPVKKKKEPKPEVISYISYKKRLWMVRLGAYQKGQPRHDALIVEANTEKGAKNKFMKWLSRYGDFQRIEIYATPFYQTSILK